MTKQDFIKLKAHIQTQLTVDPNNLQSQLLGLALLRSKYVDIFILENKELNKMKTTKDELYAELYKFYEYEANERWDTKSEIESQMYTDKRYVKMLNDIEDQQEVVTKLQQILEDIKTLSFSIKNYMDWQKFLAGE